MSGILGILQLDGAPVAASDLDRMAALLERRGPDGAGLWSDGPAGLGLTLLATTPELVWERQPVVDATTGCVIVADVRLDNRDELLARLGLAERAAVLGDAGLILAAYLAWGEGCAEHLLGDFAFVLWDPRRQALICVRDQFGMRPFYYHHSPGRFFACASEPRAILALPQTPYRINEGRIADFLVSELEGIDKTSTFFEEVYRLPPAHALIVTPAGVRIQRYWTLEPGPELRLPSDEAYAEAFLEVFTEAVRCRLRGAGPVGSMLSGGMDSGSVVAVARGLVAEMGRGPLPTFSAVGPDPATCVETRTIHAALAMDGLEPHLVSYDRLDELMPELAELTWSVDEPFDCHMTLVRALYLAAHRRGIKVVLDGAGGDVVLSEGTHLARLLRRGRCPTAWRESVGQDRFYSGAYSAWHGFCRNARIAFTPPWLRRHLRPLVHRRRADTIIDASLVRPSFASQVGLHGRLDTLDRHGGVGLLENYAQERAWAIDHPYLTVGRERYDRVAAALAVEPRDPFLDRRVAAFCLALPGEQKLSGGWPKIVQRRAMADKLPDAVRWRRGKEHLGWAFTSALLAGMKEDIRLHIEANGDTVSPYVDMGALNRASRSCFEEGDSTDAERLYQVVHLIAWLDRCGMRPQLACRLYERSFS